MDNLIQVIKERIAELEPKEEHNKKMIQEEFDPDGWSGGNFDDCYFQGVEDGQIRGELGALYRVLGQLQNLKGWGY
ncbi:hypothetical protein PQE74_gp129 [Bacillus phage vB_BanS_Chewbecca]|uniref:Uncharacterized protein n=4 Tax=Caudoviricetes TaxID=2731619 RepID=A0AAE8YWN7_9CAUD|nr:hypothetical protein PQE72_gp155 [Bacillus phage vB_BanS_Skywalker]YP_010681033.1 hypothetical protein PQE73_gp137 [Bacillus phage vB_BanS_MrDarsey]YP_010681272.1 hypothetical protein PQE74_gp129 [Bacillus phage vB_BanS_Chewbecca]UGO46212.1 hypothetical protein CHEWBECCA_129 [Bacillus phage vB_BanS_Chewbecca]UGO47969.1 hypothetical protein MRDARSEY_137 [Bacillus phage vB_BanS_MrDarsey]UGO51288.1 hypothetical protein SKYWALKER_131 [Bacillus phage vB_BanS_Skywalker]